MSKVASLRLFAVGVICAITVGIAAAQSKVGIVSMQKAVLDTAEIKKASSDLEAKYKPRQEQMAKLQRDLQEIQQQLQKGGDKLTPEAQSDLTLQGNLKQRQLQRMNEDLQSEVDSERNQILGKSSQQMQSIVQKLAEEKGLDVVFDVTNAVYFKPALDITQDATAAYDKAHPVK